MILPQWNITLDQLELAKIHHSEATPCHREFAKLKTLELTKTHYNESTVRSNKRGSEAWRLSVEVLIF